MRKALIFFIIILCFIACEHENCELDNLVSTRTVAGQVITGEMNPVVGEGHYTYTLDFGKKIENWARINISLSSNIGLFSYNDANFKYSNLQLSIPPGTQMYSFKIYWTAEKNNVTIFVNSTNESKVQVNASLSNINVKMQVVSINAPSTMNLGDSIILLASYRFVNSNHRSVWNYDKTMFSLVLDDYSEANGRYRLILKAIKGGMQSKISLGIEELFLVSNWLNVRKGEHHVIVNDPFEISVSSKFISPGGRLMAEMPKLILAPQAIVNWNSSDGLSLSSGQNSFKAIFNASNMKNGYSSIWVNIVDRSDNYVKKIDSIWIGKPLITSNQTVYSMLERQSVCISPIIVGAQVGSWKLETGNAKLFVNNDLKHVVVNSNAPLNSTDEISILLTAQNVSGTFTERYKVNVPNVAEITFTDVVKSDDKISGRIFCNRSDVDLELMLDWALPNSDNSVLFKIQDNFYTFTDAGSEKVKIRLKSSNNFEILLSGTSGDFCNAGIHITGISHNAVLGSTPAISFAGY